MGLLREDRLLRAATRAKDLLVVPAVGTEPWEGGWLSPLNPVIYPPRDAYTRSNHRDGGATGRVCAVCVDWRDFNGDSPRVVPQASPGK